MLGVAICLPTPAVIAQATISGTVRTESGDLLPFVEVDIIGEGVGIPQGPRTFTDGDGFFEVAVPAGRYVVSAWPKAPYDPSRLRVDATSGSVSGVALVVRAGPGTYVADRPPRADLISASPPDEAGLATVTGQPGAVSSGAFVILGSLHTTDMVMVEALADGSFETEIFGLPGTHLVVKSDPLGRSAFRLEHGAKSSGVTDISFINTLPAPIVRVPEETGGTGLDFVARGGIESGGAWLLSGSLDRVELGPGQTIHVLAQLRLYRLADSNAPSLSLGGWVRTQRLTDESGREVSANAKFFSTTTTPTGFPVERGHLIESTDQYGGFESRFEIAVERTGNRWEGELDLEITIPAQASPGIYRPTLSLFLSGIDTAPYVGVLSTNRDRHSDHLPILRVGEPAPPRLSWMILANHFTNGTRGLTSVEDRDSFGLASRIATETDTFVVPRLNPRTGSPRAYRIEPFLPTISHGERQLPTPPLVPFRFPSGFLTLRVEAPDGSQRGAGPSPFVQSRSISPAKVEEGFWLSVGGPR